MQKPYKKLASQVKTVAEKSTGRKTYLPDLVQRRSARITSIIHAQPSAEKWKGPDGQPNGEATPNIRATVATMRTASSLQLRRDFSKLRKIRRRTTPPDIDVFSSQGPTLKWRSWDGRDWDLRSVHAGFDIIMSEVDAHQQILADLAQRAHVSSHNHRYRLSEFLKKYYQSKLDVVLTVVPFQRHLYETDVVLSIATGFARLNRSHRKVRSMMIECDAFGLTNMELTHLLRSLHDSRWSRAMQECTPLFAKHVFTKECILHEEHQIQSRNRFNAKEVRASIKQRGDIMINSYTDDIEFKSYWSDSQRHVDTSSLWLKLAQLNDMEPRVWPAEGLLTILHMIQKRTLRFRRELNNELKVLRYSSIHAPMSQNVREYRHDAWLRFVDPFESLRTSVDDLRALANNFYALRMFQAAILLPEEMQRIISLTRNFYFSMATRLHIEKSGENVLKILANSREWERTLKGLSATADGNEYIEDLDATEYNPFQPVHGVWDVEYQPLQRVQQTKDFRTSKHQHINSSRNDFLAFKWEDWDGQPWDIVNVSNSIRLRILAVDTQKQEVQRLAQQGPISKDDGRFRLHDFQTKYHQARLDVAEDVLQFRLLHDEMRVVSYALRVFLWNYTNHARLQSLLSVVSDLDLSSMSFHTVLTEWEDFRLLAASQKYDPSSFRSGVGKYRILHADKAVRNRIELQGKTVRLGVKAQSDITPGHARPFNKSDAYQKYKMATKGLYRKLSTVEKLTLLFDTEPHEWPAEGFNTTLHVVQRRIMVHVLNLSVAISTLRYPADFTQKQINARRAIWLKLNTTNNKIANRVWEIRTLSHAAVALTSFRARTLSLAEVEKYAARSRNLHFSMTKRLDIERGLDRGYIGSTSRTMSRIGASNQWRQILRERMSSPGQNGRRNQNAKVRPTRVVDASRATHPGQKRTDAEKKRAERPPRVSVQKESQIIPPPRGSSAHVSEDIFSVLMAAHKSMQTGKLL